MKSFLRLFCALAVAVNTGSAQTWSSPGLGLGGSSITSQVNALAVYNGELYAGGNFDTAGTAAASYIAKWDGTSWSAVGGGLIATQGRNVKALAEYNGEL